MRDQHHSVGINLCPSIWDTLFLAAWGLVWLNVLVVAEETCWYYLAAVEIRSSRLHFTDADSWFGFAWHPAKFHLVPGVSLSPRATSAEKRREKRHARGEVKQTQGELQNLGQAPLLQGHYWSSQCLFHIPVFGAGHSPGMRAEHMWAHHHFLTEYQKLLVHEHRLL